MSKVQELQPEEVTEVIGTGSWVVDFFATWCGPCQMMAPVLEDAATDWEGVQVVKVDTEHAHDLAEKMNVMSLPTIVFFKDGKEVSRVIGVVDKEELNRHVKKISS